MNCSIYLWRFGRDFSDLEPFTFYCSEDELPSKIRLVLPSPDASYIRRTSYFEDCNLTYKGVPIYKEVSPTERSSQP